MYFWIQNFLDSKKVLQGIHHILDNTGVWRRSLLSEKFKLNIINDGYKGLMSVSVTNYLKTNKPKKKKIFWLSEVSGLQNKPAGLS